MKWWQRILANTLIFLALAGFLDGFMITSWTTALVAAVVFGVLNVLVKPILVILSFPITIMTLGLFYLIINGLMLWLTAVLVSGFGFSSFFLALVVAVIVSALNAYFNNAND
ncbi:MAG: phage holin family protein [Alkalibacterium sp.]|uniref:Putative membrane protein n=1 Tax=Alkalibacterium gilvum TaxID=1130080 RepID=A0A1H6SWL8_9LACT|nr:MULTISPECIES: phage holin family protein [Alkalibacterium]MDN6193817.1 phage holin family protein [Alkalibacterium sp.]MDN6293023.1 phage holin family protein [Alkalibacterium sp.]MDN6294956.1 phage holin family protein [Alkalibacterium sp.]MDN6327532.1 phage holin family protein [Alkalibacterium sp.]MDN6385282.1 phage holin family protein [Alkalibacterium sp.]